MLKASLICKIFTLFNAQKQRAISQISSVKNTIYNGVKTQFLCFNEQVLNTFDFFQLNKCSLQVK